jgi:ComF family protein
MQPGGEQRGLDTRSPFENRKRKSTAHIIDPSIPSPHFCPHCTERTPAFDCAGSLGIYRGVLRDAIHNLKYRDKPQLARPLAKLLADYAKAHASKFNDLQFDAVIAIPMHPSRRRQRGYNQAERIASAFSKELDVKIETSVIKRSRNTKSQVGLSARERAKNLTDAFTIPTPEITLGKTYLLIDDVTTTGATLDECAKALKAAGAEAVYALTLAAD